MQVVKIDDAEFRVMDPILLKKAAAIVRYQKTNGKIPLRLTRDDYLRVMKEYDRLQDMAGEVNA